MTVLTPEDALHKEAIYSLYNAFRTALINRDGTVAAPLLSGETLHHFGSLRDIANQPASKLGGLGPLERLTVLSMQRRLSGALLVGGTDLEIMTALINEGLFGAEIADLDLDSVDIVFPEAYGILKVGDQTLPLRLPFVWEEAFATRTDTWRIHWLSFLPAIRMALRGALSNSGEDADIALARLMNWRDDKAASVKKTKTRSLISRENRHGRDSL